MNCKLCNQNKELQESHIFPKFVFKWLKDTAGNYIRKPDNPNKRHQDGLKEYLLCYDCEQLFSKFENVFSRDIFYPHVKQNKTEFKYDQNLFDFSLSVLWRVLLTGYNTYKNHNTDFLEKIDNAEKEWREYLFDKKPINRFNKVFIFFTTHGLNFKIQPVKRFLYYYSRSVDGDIVFNQDTCFIYAKIARVIILGEIQNPNKYPLSNTIIDINGGILKTDKLKLDKLLKQYLIYRVTDLNNHFDKVSEKQKDIAIKYTEEQIKKLKGEEIVDIIEAQENMKIDKDFLDF